MDINLENYPPDCGKPVVIKENCLYIPLLNFLWLMFNLLGFIWLYSNLSTTTNNEYSASILIVLLMLLGSTILLLVYLMPFASSITLTPEGLTTQTILFGEKFYNWHDITNVKHEYVVLPFSITNSHNLYSQALISLITFQTPSLTKNKICLENFKVSIPDFIELIEQWRKFHTKRMTSESNENDKLEEHLFEKKPE